MKTLMALTAAFALAAGTSMAEEEIMNWKDGMMDMGFKNQTVVMMSTSANEIANDMENLNNMVSLNKMAYRTSSERFDR